MLAAEAFAHQKPAAIRVTTLSLRTMRPQVVEFRRAAFQKGWERITATADDMRARIRRVVAGEAVAVAFPEASGPHCDTCPLKRRCEALGVVTPAA